MILFLIELQQLFLLKVMNLRYHNQNADNDNQRITILPGKLRHLCKVHAIPTGNQCQRHKNRRNHCQCIHRPVLLQIQTRLIHFFCIIRSSCRVFLCPGGRLLIGVFPCGIPRIRQSHTYLYDISQPKSWQESFSRKFIYFFSYF